MPAPATRADDVLSLLLDEVWDVQEAIAELERRRDALRDQLLRACRAQDTDRVDDARGALRISRYASYKVARPSTILEMLESLDWEDQVLQVKGRALHKLAATREDVRAELAKAFPEVQHEVLTLTPWRRR